MKSFKHIIKSPAALTGIAVVLAMASCTKGFEDLNKNPYGVTEEELKWDYQHIGEPFKQIQRSIYVSNPTWVYQAAEPLQRYLFRLYDPAQPVRQPQ